MFYRSIKAYLLIISLFLSIIISSNVYSNTALNLGTNHITVYAGNSPSTSWTASNGDKYRVVTKNCPSWVILSPNNTNQSTGRIHIRPPAETNAQSYSCKIQACSTIWGTCATKSLTIKVEFDKPSYKKHTLKFNVSGKGEYDFFILGASLDCKNNTCIVQGEVSDVVSLSVIATPENGYKFSRWIGVSGCSTNPRCNITVSRSMTIGVEFVPIKIVTKKFKLNVSVKGKGSVVINSNSRSINCSADCLLSLEKGASVKLTAKADNGYLFKGWSGCASNSNVCTLSMSENKTVNAIFEKIPVTVKTFKLSVSVKGQGTVTSSPSGINCTPNCSKGYKKGTTITLTATPKAGYILDSWDGACAGLSCEIRNIDSNKSVTASFKSVDNEPKITSISPLKIRADRTTKILIKGENLPEKINIFFGSGYCNKNFKRVPKGSSSYFTGLCISEENENAILTVKNIYGTILGEKSITVVNNAPDKIIKILPILDSKASVEDLVKVRSILNKSEYIFDENLNSEYKIKFLEFEYYNKNNYTKNLVKNRIFGKTFEYYPLDEYFERLQQSPRSIFLQLKNKADIIVFIPLHGLSSAKAKDGTYTEMKGKGNLPTSFERLPLYNNFIISITPKMFVDNDIYAIAVLHELGHNFGLQHGFGNAIPFVLRGIDPETKKPILASYGKGECVDSMASIMFYPDKCGGILDKITIDSWSNKFSIGSINLIRKTMKEIANNVLD